jgi:zinc transport system substrate-binding protein
MDKRSLKILLQCAAIFLLLFSCNSRPHNDKLSVMVSIVPQKYFVEQIGAEFVDVSVLVEAGANPHMYSPRPRQIEELLRAKVYFLIGQHFEEIIIDKLSEELKDVRLVNTIKNITLRTFEQHAGQTPEEQHGATDPHTWLNPLYVIQQARIICDTLKEIDPLHKSEYEANYAILEQKLKNLHKNIQSILEPLKGETFFVFHPAYGYFADAYGLVQVAVEAGGKAVSAKKLGAILELMKEKKTRVIFSQPQTAETNVKAIAETVGARVVILDPLAYDYQENLLSMAREIKNSLQEAKQ